jgi:hypothetical protein
VNNVDQGVQSLTFQVGESYHWISSVSLETQIDCMKFACL